MSTYPARPCSLVGVGKPDPRIFEAAVDSLGVDPKSCLYVDDTLEEAEGAREFGFTSLYLDGKRTSPCYGQWTIGNLKHLVEYVELRNKSQ